MGNCPSDKASNTAKVSGAVLVPTRLNTMDPASKYRRCDARYTKDLRLVKIRPMKSLVVLERKTVVCANKKRSSSGPLVWMLIRQEM